MDARPPIVIGIAAGRRDGEAATGMLRTILDADDPYAHAGVIGGRELYDGLEWRLRPDVACELELLEKHRARAAERGLSYLIVELGGSLDDEARPDVLCSLGAGGAGTVRSGRRGLSFSSRSPIADVGATDGRSGYGLMRFRAHTPTWTGTVALPVTGLFNTGPALAAITVCELLGIASDQVASGLLRSRVSEHGGLYYSPDQRIFALIEESPEAQDGARLAAAARHDYDGFAVEVVRGPASVDAAVARGAAREGRTMLVLLDAPASELEDAFQAATRRHTHVIA